MSGSLPVVFTAAGIQPQAPADLNAQLIAKATALSPGLTANLPGSLIEDIASTATAALVVIDQARVDLVNSLTPYGANPFITTQLGQVYGIPIGTGSYTSVFVVFSGPAGFPIPKGFVVSDGTYQYVIQDGGIIGTAGQTQSLFALATQPGAWAIPAGTVKQLVTSVPTSFTVTVSNPFAGTPATGGQTEEAYRALVLQAGLASAQGTTSFLKTLLNLVPGVQPRLVSIRQQTAGGWEVIVGGSGDPYLIAYAIFQAMGDISVLTGSVMAITNITNANPGVVTTALNHGLPSGLKVTITSATGLTALNNQILTITVISQTSFSIGINTTTSGNYTGNGVVSPNFRNIITNIYDYPDTYAIPFVIPPQQTVSMVVTWNTSSTAIVSAVTVASAVQPAMAIYVNSIPVGQPMNLFAMQAAFQAATATLIPPALLTRMVFAVSINGIGVAPETGTGIIAGDPESYFQTTAASITVTQG